ncbi:tape measure protein [Hymenobacter terrenus]|uniref:tape measure protein n=1 Tax=Hymenobacter terrenus TaxID=1629124 RepID=UPI00061980A5|nr:tape measure protein [Hymenobacter terrenus]
MNLVQFALDLKDNLTAPLQRASSSVSDFVAKFKGAQEETKKGSSSMGGALGGLARMAAGAFAIGAVVSFGKSIISAGADMEATRVRYEVFTGSAKAAGEAIDVVAKLATKTPFAKTELLEYGQQLLGAGLTTDEMGKKLTTLGNISSATGKNLGELTSLYVKNRGNGKIQGEDLNQLADAKIPLQDFAKQLGTNVQGLRKLGEQGKLSFGDLDKYFESLGGTQGKWGDLNGKMSNTLTGKWSNLQDTIAQMMSDAGEGQVPFLSTMLDKLNEVLSWVQTNKAKFGAIFEPLRIAVQPVIDSISQVWESMGVGADVGKTLEGVFNGIGGAVQLVSPIIQSVSEVLGSFYSNFARIFLAFKEFAATNQTFQTIMLKTYNVIKIIFKGIADIAKGVFGGIADTIQSILKGDIKGIAAGLGKIAFTPGEVLANKDTYKAWDDKAPSFTNFFQKKDEAAAGAAAGGKGAAGAGTKSSTDTKLSTKIGDVAGTKLTTITIKIDKLVGVETQHVSSMREANSMASKSLKEELLTAINDVSILANQN